MKKIALFGGSFDPFHNGHRDLSLKVLDTLNFDEVWIIPTFDQPLKDNHSESFDHRVNIIKKSIEGYSQIKLVDIEKDLEKPSYTYNTVVELKKQYPELHFEWVIGADNLNTLDQWYRYEDLLNEIDFVVVNRDGIKAEGSFKTVDFDSKASSTAIRMGDFTYLDQVVVDYIFQEKLYLKTILHNVLSTKRADHVMRCVDVALEISEFYDVSKEDVFKAVFLHDITKELNEKETLSIMKSEYPERMDIHPKVYHQYTGASVARDKFKIKDPAILQAIMSHTTGDDESLLSMITYVADKVERGRSYDTEGYIETAKQDISKAFHELKEEGKRQREKKKVIK